MKRNRALEHISAPPDAGGHLGAFTRPEDLRSFEGDPPGVTENPAPQLHRMVGRGHGEPVPFGAKDFLVTLVGVTVLFVLVAGAFFVW